MNFKKLNLLLIFLFSACASTSPKVFMLEKINSKKRVVILPFKNSTKNQTIRKILYRVLLIRLIESKKFTPIEEGIVRDFLIKNRLYPGDFPSLNQLEILKNLTHAEIIIGGQILEAGYISGDVKITLILWGRDANTGKLLWTTYYVKKGEDYRKIFHFGKVFSLGELAIKMIDDIVKSWEQKGG